MIPFREIVAGYRVLMERGRLIQPEPVSNTGAGDGAGPVVMLFSPHPDDECIIGGLPLRLIRDGHARVVNIAVTLGSREDQRARRRHELRAACDALGFELLEPVPGGFDFISKQGKTAHPENWKRSVCVIATLLQRYNPAIILFPHTEDWNGTHEGVHMLVMEALAAMPETFKTHLMQTEFWRPMKQPNLMLEIPEDHLAHMMNALAMHVGEVERNPYHLRLPAWMMDNVRRGGEVVGGQGGDAPDFTFATLYRFSAWTGATEVVPQETFVIGKDDGALEDFIKENMNKA